MGSWSTGKTITKQTFGIVKANPYMLLFPVVAAILAVVAMAVVAGAGLGLLGLTEAQQIAESGQVTTRDQVIGVIVLIIAAYLATLISQLFTGGLVAAADDELQGRDSSFGAGMGRAFGRFGAIAGWAGIETAVGWLLSAVRDGGNNNGLVSILRAILGSLMAVAWSILTFFVLPMIVLRGHGPITAIKESFSLIKRVWGTSLAGGVRIGGLVVLLGVLPGILVLVGGGLLTASGHAVAGIPLLSIGTLVIIVASVLVSALRAVFSVAMLHYAEDGTVLGPYDDAELRGAVRVKA